MALSTHYSLLIEKGHHVVSLSSINLIANGHSDPIHSAKCTKPLSSLQGIWMNLQLLQPRDFECWINHCRVISVIQKQKYKLNVNQNYDKILKPDWSSPAQFEHW